MTENLKIWDALSKTDPAHTTAFQRPGGFRGTAIRPIYVIKKMTEFFGPCGIGWGMSKPQFETVSHDGEVVVNCLVEIWYGKRDQTVWGVGGDRVFFRRKDGAPVADDEAYKKAYTDALTNAMVKLGVSADVHMGRFDDSKYVSSLKEEFGESSGRGALCGPLKITELKNALRKFAGDLEACSDLDSLDLLLRANKEVLDQCERDLPSWYFGDPKHPDVKGAKDRIMERTEELGRLVQA